MLDEQDGEGEVVAKGPDEVREALDLLVAETARRLVEQEQPRLGRECPRELDLLPGGDQQSHDGG
jgi:hypothetical protein